MRGRRKSRPDVALPVVNILSPSVFEAIATRRLRRRLALAGCGVGLVVGAGWAVQELRVSHAHQVLTIEQAEGDRLGARTRALAPVRAYVAAVEQQKRTVQSAMAGEVYLSRALEGLRSATPTGVIIESLSVTVAAPAPVVGKGGSAAAAAAAVPAKAPGLAAGVSACPGPDPFNTRPVAGCITLSGSAANRRAVGDFVITLGRSGLFVEPFISTTTTAAGEGVMFTGSVGMSPSLFSGRYADLDRLLAGGADQ